MLGEKIYSLRKNRKISQEEFAEILNTSRQNISKWERNESKPDIDKLIIIARLFMYQLTTY
jgi:transcriptional regulator with XRE-family HTH domain